MKINREHIIHFLSDEGIGYSERKERGELLINSPVVSDSKKKAGINYKKNGAWNCFKSGESGSFWKFVKIIKGFENEKISKLYFIKNYFSQQDLLSSVYDNDEIISTHEEELFLPEDSRRINKNDKVYYDYLLGRHFTDEIIERSNVMISEKERRVIFPIYERGRLSFFARRSVDPLNPLRWLNSKSENSNPVWNIENVGSEIFIFEGLFDAIRLWPKGVAIFGNTLREGQMQKILDKDPYKIVVVLDGDDVGRDAQKRAAKKLASKHDNVWIHLWNKEDEKDFSAMEKININETLWNTKGQLLHAFNEAIR